MEIRAVGGTAKLDFTDAIITGPTLQIQAEASGHPHGSSWRPKPGIEVDADDVAVHGGKVKLTLRFEAPGGYPVLAGGPWLCRTFVLSGFHAVVVPSGLSTRVHPHRWITI